MTLIPSGDNNAPLPELIARQWAFPLQIREVDDKDFYAVQDWLRGVAQPADVRRFWNAMKRRLKKDGIEMSTWCRHLPYKASDGKTYQMDYTDAQGLYSITQRMDSNTGIRNAVLDFLAKAGVKLDEYRLDPSKAIEDAASTYQKQGKSDKWINARAEGVISRKDFTDALRDVVAGIDGRFYAESTENVYRTLWDRTSAQLRGDLGLSKHQNPRDHFDTFGLIYTRLAEAVAAERLRDFETVSRALAAEIIHEVTTLIKTQADATSKALGRDLVTGQPLLAAPKGRR